MATTQVNKEWRELLPRIEELALRSGLQYNPVDFEAVPRKRSWTGNRVRMDAGTGSASLVSLARRYISQLIQHRMGHSRLFEVVFPGNPGHAYLAAGNSLAENVLVTAQRSWGTPISRATTCLSSATASNKWEITSSNKPPPMRGKSRSPSRNTACSAWNWYWTRLSLSNSTSTWLVSCSV